MDDQPSSGHSNKTETLCRVCGDKASGKHYGVASCDGCRGFFKRSIRRNLEYVCKENGRCIVDVTRRNQCQACRFRKCLQVNMKRDAVQHERAPRTSHTPLHYPSIGGPMGHPLLGARSLRAVHSAASLFAAGLPLHLQASAAAGMAPPPPTLGHMGVGGVGLGTVGVGVDTLAGAAPGMSTYLQSGFLYPSMLAGFAVKPTFLTTGLMSSSSAFTNKIEPAVPKSLSQRVGGSCKDDEVSSSEEATATNSSTERTSSFSNEEMRDTKLPPLEETRKNVFDITIEPMRQSTRSIDMSCLTMLPTENIYESAAKLLFLSVKWARTIPSFLQLSYRDQSILLEESWSELFVLTAAQWSLPIDENVLISNAISPSTRHLTLEEDARKLRDVISRLTLLRVDHTEYACLKALVLFKSECRGICDPSHVELLQDQTHVMLHEYCTSRLCSHKGRFGKLLLSLPAIQSVSRRSLEELLFRKTIGDVAIERLLGDMMKASTSN